MIWLAAALAGCRAPAPGSAEALAAYLETVASADAETRQREAAGWMPDAQLWDATVIAAYRPLHADVQQAFAAALPALVAQLARPGARGSPGSPGSVTVRRHYAGDPRLTLAQSRDRWALPTLFPSLVAEIDGAPLDAVFIPDGDRWRALVGLDAVVRARVARLDPDCAAQLARAGPTGRCTDVGAAIADAALRTDRDRLAHVCRLADTLCGKEAP